MNIVERVMEKILSEQSRMKMEISLPPDLLKIVKHFKSSGAQVFLVGGSVRDTVMGKTPKDYDLATNINPDEVISLFRGFSEYKLLTVGKSFGVVVIVTPEGNEYEVATFRKDVGTGRRPDHVEFTDISSDVMRRDLTINALFYDLLTHEIVDFVGGLDDIKNNVVRTVGNPEQRFAEDRLRVLRALRFAGRMGASLDPTTAQAIFDNNSLSGVSHERIRDEFLKGIVSAKSVIDFLTTLDKFGMFSQVFPGLLVNSDFKETKNIPVQLSLLLRDNDTIFLSAKLNLLKYSAEEVSQITFLTDFKDMGPGMPIVRMKKSYRNSKLNDSDILEYSRFMRIESLAQKFLNFQLSVSPAELMSQGLSGKKLGDEISRIEQDLWERK